MNDEEPESSSPKVDHDETEPSPVNVEPTAGATPQAQQQKLPVWPTGWLANEAEKWVEDTTPIDETSD